MAGRPVGDGLHEQGVVVAIHSDAHEVEEIAAGFTLGPETVARTAPERHLLRQQRFVVSLFVHIAEHQHILGVGILNDGRHQAAAFLKIYLQKQLKKRMKIRLLQLMIIVSNNLIIA